MWTSTKLVAKPPARVRREDGTERVATSLQWNARVRRADGSERVLKPRHLVFANGIGGARGEDFRAKWSTPLDTPRVRAGVARRPWCIA